MYGAQVYTVMDYGGLVMSDYIQSALVLGDLVLTASNSLYLDGETVIKIYMGDMLIYGTKRIKQESL